MIRDLLYPGCQARIWAHVETPFKKGRRPIDQSRYLFDSDNPAAVLADCENAAAQGVQAFMYNSYAKGSFEDKARAIYLAATQAVGMKQLINVDGANITSLSAFQAYIVYTKQVIDGVKNYETWNGKPVVTYFAKDLEPGAWFQQIEHEHPDICFVYYGTPYGKNRMDWIKSALLTSQESFCQQYSANHDGGLYVPCVFMGFDDTVMRTVGGHPTATTAWWNGSLPVQPARVWPAGGPNAATWAQCFANLNKYYSKQNPLPVVQLVTWNDLDEGSGLLRGIPRL